MRQAIDRAEESSLAPMSATALPPVESVLGLAPHADDEVFGCGGSLNLLVQAGAAVHVVVATDGAQAGLPHTTRSADGGACGKRAVLPDEREEESCAAAKVLGSAPPTFWRLP